MATGDITFFNSFKEWQLDATGTNTPVDFDADDIRVALVDNTTAPAAATHDYWSDLQANEVSGTNYTAGGYALTSTLTESGGTVTWDADDATWAQSGAGFSDAYWGIIYKYNATAANAPLIAYVELGGPKGNTGGSLTISWAGTGIGTLT